MDLKHVYSKINPITQTKTGKKFRIIEDLKAHNASMAVIGLGYVGLPLALEFAKDLSVIGFDIKQNRVNMMNAFEDPSGELERSAFENKNIDFTANIKDLEDCKFYIVAVPTPVDANKKPNLNALIGATQTVARDRKSTRLNSSHIGSSRMPSSA